MVMAEPDSNPPSRRKLGLYLYIIMFIIVTCIATVSLSIRGYIPFDPLTALLAGFIAGCAFVMFQLTYLRFIANSTHRMHQKDPDIV
ncbi:MAG: hypothetical protein PVJ05_12065 [Candidatus Thorarchaeota archaeon]